MSAVNLLDLLPSELEELAESLGAPRYRGRQIATWIYKKGAVDIDGMSDLRPHLAAVHRFMPGMRITRDGDIRHCQAMVLADWVARSSDGQERGRGTNVFVLAPGRIDSVTGFWEPPKG